MVNRFLKLVGFMSVLAAVFLFVQVRPANASPNENIRGWAYNSTYGYISFNCLDDGFAGRFPFTFTFPFNIPPCSYNNHGVNLDADNNFSGDAWNSVLGFITFDATSTPPDTSYRAHCEKTCDTSNTCTACYNETDEQVYGYMRIVSTGEWIRLDDPSVPPSARITNYLAPQPGIFSGYASSTFGAISLNCTNDGSCGTNPYEVKIGPLQIRQMIAPNWDSYSACATGARHAVLKWNRRSGTQSAYQVIVSTQNSTSTGIVINSGIVNNSATQFSFTPSNYDTPYYWFLTLWDQDGVQTPWRQFDTNGTKDLLNNNNDRNLQIGNSKTFTTYKHEFPLPAFTWTPEEIVIATSSNSFVSNSSYYNDANVLQPCSGSVCLYQWSTSDSGAIISASTSASTSIMFTKATNTTIILTSTDDDIYSCSTSTTLNINYTLPLWKEIKAH